jgi:rhamnosyltransferase
MILVHPSKNNTDARPHPMILVHPSKNNTLAVVVSFYPDRGIIKRIKRVSDQVARVLIVDNTPRANSLDFLTFLTSCCDNIDVVFNENKGGQASALNIGIKSAIDNDYKWVLLLDQDSLVSSDFIESMSSAYQKYNDSSVVSIAPVLRHYNGIDENSSNKLWVLSGRAIMKEDELIKMAITSGNLLCVNVFSRVGLFNDDFFIDYVDLEFCLRLSKAKYSILQSSKTVLNHSMGNASHHKFLGINFAVANNSPIRAYYAYRNAIATYKNYLFLEPAWVINNCIRALLFNLIKIILFESSKKEKIFFALKGTIHGFLNVLGPHD